MDLVVGELTRIELMVNAGKTAAWTLDPLVPLPGRLAGLRVSRCEVLGATAPWLDEQDLTRVGVHCLADGAGIVRSAEEFVSKLVELRGGGLSKRWCFVLLQSFSHGHVTHFLRSNYEASGWPRQFDDVLVRGVEGLVGEALGQDQREQCFLRLAGGGLGLASAERSAEAAYLGSWGLLLKDVCSILGVNSWEGFRSKCGPLADKLAEAEAKLLQAAGESIRPVDWVSLLSEPKPKLQGFWSGRLHDHQLRLLLARLLLDEQVDLRSAGGPGAGGFLEAPVAFDDMQPKAMPDQHFCLMLRDRLRLSVCQPGATCQHRQQDGSLCGAVLDARGKHALKCEVGPGREARHNALRDFTAEFHPKASGYMTAT